jgi:hypothetical protein
MGSSRDILLTIDPMFILTYQLKPIDRRTHHLKNSNEPEYEPFKTPYS